jgi:chemotaxis protein MotB
MKQIPPKNPGIEPAPAVTAAPSPVKPPRHVPSSAAASRLFDGGDASADDDTMRSNWAVPWSDLMMTMFVLFAALLAAQTAHKRAGHGKETQVQQIQVPPQQIAELPGPETTKAPTPAPTPEAAAGPSSDSLKSVDILAKSKDAVRDADLKNVQIAELDDKSVQVRMQGAMFFASGKAELRPEVLSLLDRLAQVIRETPYDIQVVGHTDDVEINTGAFPSNWELSLARANQVAHHLMEAGGIEPSRFMVVGRGKYHPLGPNTDEQSRALNRRVEIIITRNVSTPGGDEIR